MIQFSKASYSEVTDLPIRTVICGKIKNTDVYPNAKEISVEVRDFRDINTVFSSPINSDGTFQIELSLYAIQDVESKLFDKLFLHPGDSIFINLDFKDRSYAQFSGDRSKENEVLHHLWDCDYSISEEMDIKTYKGYCDSLYSIYWDQFNELKKENLSSEFTLWIENQIKIDYYEALLIYPNCYYVWCDYKVHEEWMDSTLFLKSIEDEFENYGNTVINSEFYEFIEEYFGKKHLDSEEKETTLICDFSEYRTNLQKIELAFMLYTMLCQNEIVLFDYSTEVADSTIYIKDEIYSAISIPSIREPLFEFYQVLKGNEDNSHYFTDAILNKMDVDGSNLLDSIISGNRGKVLFVDLWATYCGPCLEGMKESKEIMPKYADKDIEFIFICIETTEEAWKSRLSQMEIGGQHYICNKTESEAIRKAIGADGIPHYLLINKQGDIVNPDCSDLNESQDRIDKLLDEE